MNFKCVLVAMAMSAGLAGCNFKSTPEPSLNAKDAEYMALVPAFDMDLNYQRYEIDDPTGEAPGTVIVDTKQNFLYYVLANKKAIRYGVTVGEEALAIVPHHLNGRANTIFGGTSEVQREIIAKMMLGL